MTREGELLIASKDSKPDEEFRISCLFREGPNKLGQDCMEQVLFSLDIKGDVDVSKPLNIEGLGGCINTACY